MRISKAQQKVLDDMRASGKKMYLVRGLQPSAGLSGLWSINVSTALRLIELGLVVKVQLPDASLTEYYALAQTEGGKEQ